MTERVAVQTRREFVATLFRAAGIPEDDASVCAGAFLLQEMRGVKTHSLRRLRGMLDQLRSGEIRPKREGRVLHADRATIIIDGDFGPGILC